VTIAPQRDIFCPSTIRHYQKIIKTLFETDRIMKMIEMDLQP